MLSKPFLRTAGLIFLQSPGQGHIFFSEDVKIYEELHLQGTFPIGVKRTAVGTFWSHGNKDEFFHVGITEDTVIEGFYYDINQAAEFPYTVNIYIEIETEP